MNPKRTEYMLYSKSNVHAGAIAALMAKYTSNEYKGKGHGSGEFFKASAFRIEENNIIPVKNMIEDTLKKKIESLKSLGVYTKYHSQVEGKPFVILLYREKENFKSGLKIDLYPPYSTPEYDVDLRRYFGFKNSEVIDHAGIFRTFLL